MSDFFTNCSDLCQLTKRARQALYYNKGARDFSPLEEGAVVRMRPFRLEQRVWEQATVTKRHDERSYEVETEKGTYRRSRADPREQPTPQRSLQQTPSVKQTPEQTPSDTPLKDQGMIQAEANSTPETAGPKQQTTPVSVAQHPNRTTREPAYLRDYVR